MDPRVRIVLESCRSARAAACWLVAWRAHNDGDEPLHIDEAWVPHGRFRGASGHIPVKLTIGAGQSGIVELKVAAAGAPGTVVQNAFLILRAGQCRIFARMRIEFDDDATPRIWVTRVTTQSIQ